MPRSPEPGRLSHSDAPPPTPRATILLLIAPDGSQSALSPAGLQAERIYALWWFLLAVSCAVFVLVIGAMLYAAFRRRREDEASSEAEEEEKNRRMTRWVAGAAAVSILVLFTFLVVDFTTGRAIGAPAPKGALTIHVTGHQWWWEAEYVDPVPSRRLTTANEIHVPVGRPVRLRLTSADVIHSFWVPKLHGKKDLIPGHQASTWFRADSPGVYRGQCAEYCGHQHAKMAFLIIAEPPEKFSSWYEQQLRPAFAPADSTQLRGQRVFLSSACVLCHTIRGTPAGSRVGPELTHLGSRRTIAAGTLPNTRGHLGGWIVDPQRIKPGVRMPPNQLAPDDLNALLDYLGSLK